MAGRIIFDDTPVWRLIRNGEEQIFTSGREALKHWQHGDYVYDPDGRILSSREQLELAAGREEGG